MRRFLDRQAWNSTGELQFSCMALAWTNAGQNDPECKLQDILSFIINKTHRKLKKSNMYVFMSFCKICNFLELFALLNCVHFDSIGHQGAQCVAMLSEIMQLAAYHGTIGRAGLESVLSRNQQFAVVVKALAVLFSALMLKVLKRSCDNIHLSDHL